MIQNIRKNHEKPEKDLLICLILTIVYVDPVQQNLALGRPIQSGQDFDKGTLPGTVFADDTHFFVRVDFDTQVFDSINAAPRILKKTFLNSITASNLNCGMTVSE